MINGGGVAKTTQDTGVFIHTVKAGENGAVSYSVSVTDKAGNIATATSGDATIGVDNTAPNKPSVASSNAVGGTAYKSITETDTYYYKGSGINFTFIANDVGGSEIKGYTTDNTNPASAKNLLLLTTGTHTVYAVDNALNVSATGLELTVAEDKTAPSVAPTISSNNSTKTLAKAGNKITLSVPVTEGGSGIKTYSVTMSINGVALSTSQTQSNTTYTTTSTVPAGKNGDVSYSITVTDNVGNVSTTTSGTGSVFVDTILPEVSASIAITSRSRTILPENYVNANDDITLTVTASDEAGGSGLATNAYTGTILINGGGVAKTTQDTGVFIHTVKAGENGAVSYSVSVTDKAGNIATATSGDATIGVDNTAPNKPSVASSNAVGGTAYKSITETDTYYYSGSGINFTFTANDGGGSGIKGYVVKAGSTTPSDTDLETATKNAILRTTGTHTVYAVDNARNVSTGLTLTVAEDNDKPTVASNVIINNTVLGYVKSNAITVTIPSATEAGSGVAGYAIINGSTKPDANATGDTWKIWNGTSPISAATHTLSGFDGVKNIYVWVKDNVGNVSDVAKTDSVTLDTTAPRITGVRVDGSTVSNGNTFKVKSGSKTVSITGVTESGSGIKGYQITTSSGKPASGSWRTSVTQSFSSGTYYLWAKDNVGNVSSTAFTLRASRYAIGNTGPGGGTVFSISPYREISAESSGIYQWSAAMRAYPAGASWYLPSKDILEYAYSVLPWDDSFQDIWSSTEFGAGGNNAYYMWFNQPTNNTGLSASFKGNSKYVRAVRDF